MERKRIQQSLSRSNIQFVPSQPDNKKLSDAKKTSEEEEGKKQSFVFHYNTEFHWYYYSF